MPAMSKNLLRNIIEFLVNYIPLFKEIYSVTEFRTRFALSDINIGY